MLGTFPRVADPSLILQTDAKGLRVQQAQIVFVHQDVETGFSKNQAADTLTSKIVEV